MEANTDEQRFTQLYQQHHAAVTRYVLRRVPVDEVTDVVSEVFVTAWRRLDEIPPAKSLPWLYGVARRTLANAHRAQQRRGSLVERLATQPQPEVADCADSVVADLSLARAFDGLSDADKEVLRLALWEELPARQAALVVGCSAATFHVRLHRARTRLRTSLAGTNPSRQQQASQTNFGRADA
ncbi:RNA polymerase sigma factor [Streptomyces chilikensis]|uniref:Sigma-70 family RNA polymerase sigma factor n=1 Tax=Streptomyces chilikensis TaxID=1194079 RepID=A0ABV3EJI3_9ACTN